jgi:hypothetical protein
LALAAATAAARADASPVGFMGDPVIAIGIILVLVVLVWFFIRGALGIAARDKSDEDDAGVGILEGIDEDDDKPKRR